MLPFIGNLFIAALVIQLSSCASAQYYGQAISGHLDIMAKRQPIPKLLARNDTPSDLKQKRSAVLQVREFASGSLGLPGKRSYSSYADLKRPYVAWNVFAAPEFSLEPREWCFPFAGCVRYRAYFAKAEAMRFASALQRRGDDVYVSGAAAYSTLGWFSDPVLNTFLEDSKANIARLIFHELAHQRLYIPGDSAFNEAFAVAVERESLRRWLIDEGMDEEHALAQQRWARQDRMMEHVRAARAQLGDLYADQLPTEVKRHRKALILAALSEQLHGIGLRRVSSQGHAGNALNNAYLIALGTYYALVPAFEALLAAQGGDLEAFYRAAEEFGRLPKRERRLRLQTLATEAYARRHGTPEPVGLRM
jgi:predicted aminopeptidase